MDADEQLRLMRELDRLKAMIKRRAYLDDACRDVEARIATLKDAEARWVTELHAQHHRLAVELADVEAAVKTMQICQLPDCGAIFHDAKPRGTCTPQHGDDLRRLYNRKRQQRFRYKQAAASPTPTMIRARQFEQCS